MAQNRSALANKPEVREAHRPSSLFNRAERRLTGFLHEIKNEPPGKDAPQLQPVRPRAEELLRTFILTDAAAMIAGFISAWLLAVAVNSNVIERNALEALSKDNVVLAMQFMLLGAGVLLWFGHTGHYQLRMPFWMETKKIVETASFAVLIGCFLQFVSKENFSRLWLMSCWLFSAFGMIGLRSLCRIVWRRRGTWQISTLIVGDGPTADEACAALNSEPGLGYNFTGQIADLPTALQAAGHSWRNLCHIHGADYVMIAMDGDDFVDARQPLAQLMRERIPFSVSPPMHNLSVFGMVPQYFLGHDVMLLVRNSGLDRPLPQFVKRCFDVAVSAAALVVLSPVILALALIVRLDGSPAFYRHMRIGLNGEIFSCIKFRSMVSKSEAVLKEHLEKYPLAKAEWQRDHKLRKDPRITMVGAFLRRTSLDELPQLINVLRGEMSIVGPRPIIVAETKKYDHDIAFYYRVRPGITGLWQVSGRNDVTYSERVRMDSWYVRNWSLWLDIALICKTFVVVLKQDGAY